MNHNHHLHHRLYLIWPKIAPLKPHNPNKRSLSLTLAVANCQVNVPWSRYSNMSRLHQPGSFSSSKISTFLAIYSSRFFPSSFKLVVQILHFFLYLHFVIRRWAGTGLAKSFGCTGAWINERAQHSGLLMVTEFTKSQVQIWYYRQVDWSPQS